MQDKFFTGFSSEFPAKGFGWPFSVVSRGRRILASWRGLEGGTFNGQLSIPDSWGNTVGAISRPEVTLADPAIPAVLHLGIRYDTPGVETVDELLLFLAPRDFVRTVFATKVSAQGATVRWDPVAQSYSLYAAPGSSFTLQVESEGYRVDEVFYSVGWKTTKNKYAPKVTDNQHLPLGASFTVPGKESLLLHPTINFELRRDEGIWTREVPVPPIYVEVNEQFVTPEVKPTVASEVVGQLKAIIAKLEGK